MSTTNLGVLVNWITLLFLTVLAPLAQASSHEMTPEAVQIANSLLQPHGLRVSTYEVVQRLWAGYGQICSIQAVPLESTDDFTSQPRPFILKHVTPPVAKSAQDEGHLRKLISYQVEQYFYSKLAPELPEQGAAVAQCLGSVNESENNGSTIAMLLTDLRKEYPVAGEKRGELDKQQVYAAAKWLATFHGFWWKRTAEIRGGNLRLPPLEDSQSDTEGVWLNGGYTYLATRRKEYASLQSDSESEWSKALCLPIADTNLSISELVANVLSPHASKNATSPISDYETLIHGDVKSENLFSNAPGSAVAFFDFQYVGLGLGVSDLAKLFTCSVPLEMLTDQDVDDLDGGVAVMSDGEETLLGYYWTQLQDVSGKSYPREIFEMHWRTALVDWHRFQASWGAWGNVEWLQARVRYILQDERWLEWVIENGSKPS